MPSLVGFLVSSLETRQVVHLGTVQLFGNRHLDFDYSPSKQGTSCQNHYFCLMYVRADCEISVQVDRT
jgi:hypothetical protein